MSNKKMMSLEDSVMNSVVGGVSAGYAAMGMVNNDFENNNSIDMSASGRYNSGNLFDSGLNAPEKNNGKNKHKVI